MVFPEMVSICTILSARTLSGLYLVMSCDTERVLSQPTGAYAPTIGLGTILSYGTRSEPLNPRLTRLVVLLTPAKDEVDAGGNYSRNSIARPSTEATN